MEVERLQDLSIFYWVRNLFPSFVTVVDAFPANINQDDTPLTLPVISVYNDDLSAYALEMGGLEHNKRLWVIDVFGKNKSQRDDFAYTIVRELKSNILVYNYDLGFPPIVVPCIGALLVNDIQARPVRVFRELVKDLYWRSSITFSTKYQFNT